MVRDAMRLSNRIGAAVDTCCSPDCLFVRTMRRLKVGQQHLRCRCMHACSLNFSDIPQVLQLHHAPTFAKIFTRPLVEHVREKGGKEFWDKLAKQDEATKQFISDTWPADRDSDICDTLQ
jgi:hypothetical protein